MQSKIGQCWTYKRGKATSFCKILKIEGDTVHISVKNTLIKNEYFDIDHLPFSRASFNSSILNLIKKEVVVEDELEGVLIWENEKGGIWDIPVYDVIQITINSLNEND